MILQELIKASQLGTSRYVPEADVFPEALQELYHELKPVAEDNEDFFLRMSAATILYFESGKKLSVSDKVLEDAPEEEHAYLPSTAESWLRVCSRSQEDRPLLEFFLEKASAKKLLAPPDLIPELLNMAIFSEQPLRGQLAAITGKRGFWMSGLNPVWKDVFAATKELSEELWQTGTKEERKRYLAFIRKQDPAQGIALLKETLSKENANMRVELLEVLADKVVPADEEYLESLLNDKSIKVRDTVYMLLRMLPESRLIKLYQHWLLQGLEIKEERSITLQKKKHFKPKKFEITDEEIFKSGVEKVSSEKKKEDYIHWLDQMAAWVPPSWWATLSDESLENTVETLSKEKSTVFLAKAMMSAAVLFEDKKAAAILAKKFPGENADILRLLEANEAFEQVRHFSDANLRQAIDQFLDRADLTEWPVKGAKDIFAALTKNPYAITAQEYAAVAMKFPKEMIPVLKGQIESTNQRRYEEVYFSGRCENMLNTMERKVQLITSF